MFRFSLFALALIGAVNASGVINEHSEIRADSDAARNLMKHARSLQDNNNNAYYQNDGSFLPGYSVKFQGCHHVQQWNADAYGEDDVKIMTKRLVRFRLCPSSDCTNELTGCTSNYGDYVVDMETFVAAYLSQQYGGQNQGNRELENDYSSLAYCSEFGGRRELQDNGNYQYYDADATYYMGPYCADQGGEIRIGMFQDDTCSIFASNGESMYYAAKGTSLPYSSKSIVSMNCISCSTYGATSEFCSDIYQYAGKCETRMKMNYPNEASCSYIEGIKIIREDGVIRTASTKKSKAAAVSIGVFLTVAVLLAGYVYYLRTKLSRAKINLNAASQSLG